MRTSTTLPETKQVVIVEDDDDSRRALTNVLEDEGFSVAPLSSCEAALDYLHGSPRPDLIVLDLMMPGMEGWEFRHVQKGTPELAGIPVISVSAVGKLVDVDVTLRKPVDYDELVQAVERYVTRRVDRPQRSKAKRTPHDQASDHSPNRGK